MQPQLAEFQQAFEAIQGYLPFPWQERLFQLSCDGLLPSAIDLPTGLGKTSVISIWYLALMAGAPVPRRLIYVVDRRAVVDQATTIAENLKKQLGDTTLRVSTLRGQHADNREWLSDPTAPAIVVGTVDMIGSRLLFSGYGVSQKMRPYHAGFLGADTLLVLDEAHLVPPFEALLKSIARHSHQELGPWSDEDCKIVPRFRLMSLSATCRKDTEISDEEIFALKDEDNSNAIVKKRLEAEKRLTLSEVPDFKTLIDQLAQRAWVLGTEPKRARVLIYCRSREGALKIKESIDQRAKKLGIRAPTELLIGQRRVREREALVKWLVKYGFIADVPCPADEPTFLVATSAGEVGVDLDADHMVCDLVEWERMVQRLGRVNRRGAGQARVEVIAAPAKEIKLEEKWEDRLAQLRAPFEHLPVLSGNHRDASPAAIVALTKKRAFDDLLNKASTPVPSRPALTRAVLDSWSMSSLETHTGRPDIQPWLRGWEQDDEPQTGIVWRKLLPVRAFGPHATKKEINEFFDAAPVHMTEVLETETWRAIDWLVARAKAALKTTDTALNAINPHTQAVMVLNRKGQFEPFLRIDQIADLVKKENKRDKDALLKNLSGCTIVISSVLCGLNTDGMLDDNFQSPPVTIEDWESWEPVPAFRLRETDDAQPTTDNDWRESYLFAVEEREEDAKTSWIIIDQWRGEGQSEEGRGIARNEQTLKDHRELTQSIIRGFAIEIGLPPPYVEMLVVAARLHDEGKAHRRWQRAFNAPDSRIYAKTKGPINFKLLDGYRHEFGSLVFAEKDAELKALSPELQDLALHLIAAHHGGARPLISAQGCEDAPPSLLAVRARDVALRFARQQKRWGPWGLAWWEALLRAADQHASRLNDERETEETEMTRIEENV